MTKKAVELVTHPRGFLQKKASSILSEISDGAAAFHSLQYGKESSERVWSKGDL